jgi:hypothetical protein
MATRFVPRQPAHAARRLGCLLRTTLGAHLCFPQDVLVETFRAMAELLTWGDQHEPAIFDFFVEKRVRRTRAQQV